MTTPPAASTPDESLDTLGTVCPLPLLMTAKAMLRLQPGQTLEVVGDDPAILDDMPIFCLRAGHRLVEMVEEGGVVVCRIEKLAS